MSSAPRGRGDGGEAAGAIGDLLARSRLELLPLKGVRKAARHAAEGATLTVSCSPTKGIDATLRAIEELAELPCRLVPHIAARKVIDRAHLDEVVTTLERLGVTDVFVPGGDSKEPAGRFTSALELLRALDERGHSFEQIGVTADPEGHWLIDDDTLFEALRAKQRFATYAVTQMCFSAESIVRCARNLADRGIDLDIYAGIAGVVDAKKLATIGLRIGIGNSLRFLSHQSDGLGRIVGMRAYRPTQLVGDIAGAVEHAPISGFHIYTFNQVGSTEAWRRQLVAGAGETG